MFSQEDKQSRVQGYQILHGRSERYIKISLLNGQTINASPEDINIDIDIDIDINIDNIIMEKLEEFVDKKLGKTKSNRKNKKKNKNTNNRKQRAKTNIENILTCPICCEFMKKPVILNEKKSYCKQCITKWIQTCCDNGLQTTDPVTNVKFRKLKLVDNNTLSELCTEWKELCLK